MKKYVICILFTFIPVAFQAKNSTKKRSFLISTEDSSNRVSKNELKEDIGEELKKALYLCASISSELGSMQKKIAKLQNRFLSRVENLVENKRPFKKAKRKDLSNAFDIMRSVRGQLNNQKAIVKNLAMQLDENKCLKDASPKKVKKT